jgi:hypothetical protein
MGHNCWHGDCHGINVVPEKGIQGGRAPLEGPGVRRRSGDESSGDIAGGTRRVLYDNVYPSKLAPNLIGYQPANDIRCTSGSEANNECDWLARHKLRGCRLRRPDRDNNTKKRSNRYCQVHHHPSP